MAEKSLPDNYYRERLKLYNYQLCLIRDKINEDVLMLPDGDHTDLSYDTLNDLHDDLEKARVKILRCLSETRMQEADNG